MKALAWSEGHNLFWYCELYVTINKNMDVKTVLPQSEWWKIIVFQPLENLEASCIAVEAI